ncbi:MAG: hypothetical protein EOO46_01260 [Flavobacterium sp.]|nr:MAG: hypothetical protein EOO46_01260 [Flavobacterium sp.]
MVTDSGTNSNEAEFDGKLVLIRFANLLHILCKERRQREILDILEKRKSRYFPDHELNFPTSLSRYKKPEAYSASKHISAKTASFMMKILEDYTREQIHKELFWDIRDKEYRFSAVIDNDRGVIDVERINSLKGTWIAYSWDQFSTKKFKKDHIHAFKLKIEVNGSVVCDTKRVMFTCNQVELVLNRIILRLTAEDESRYVFMACDLGGRGNQRLKSTGVLYFMYLDTGASCVSTGLVILVRTNEPYENIAPESVVADAITPYYFYEDLKENYKPLPSF